MTNLSPADFEQKPLHFLELDPVPSETFEQYTERHLLMLRHAYTLAEGVVLSATALTDGQIERVFVPREDESNEQYFARVREQAKTFRATRTFSHTITPMIRTVHGETKTLTTMLWYAEDILSEESTAGALDPTVVDGLHTVLEDIDRANMDELKGWLADAYRAILH